MRTNYRCRFASINPVIVASFAMLLLTGFSADATITVLRHYHLGDSDPGAADGVAATTSVDSVGGATLTLSGSPSYTNSTYSTNSSLSLRFSGSQFGLATTVPSLTDNFGIEAWVRTDTNSGSHFVCYNGNTGSNGWGILQSSTNYIALFGGVIFFGSAPASTNTWTHVALVRDNGTATFYVNGVAAGSTALSPNATGGPFGIATTPENPGGGTWIGLLDEVRLFTFAAGAFQMKDLLLQGPVLSVSQQSSSLFLTWPSVTSRSYGLETATNLTTTNWSKLLAHLTNSFFAASNSISNRTAFYRLNSLVGPPCGTNLPPYLPNGSYLLANGNPITNSTVTVSGTATNIFDASAFIDPAKCEGDTLSWLWTVTLNGINATTGLSGNSSSILTVAPGLVTGGICQVSLRVTGSSGLFTNVTFNPSAPFDTNTPIQLELTLREAPGVSSQSDRTNRYTSVFAFALPDGSYILNSFSPYNAGGVVNDVVFNNVDTNILEVRIIGSATNYPSAYSYQWRVDATPVNGDYHARGISGYSTSKLIIKINSLPSDSSPQEVDYSITVTRLLDGRQEEFVFKTFNLDSSLDIPQAADCQNASTACDTCPCHIENALGQ